MFLSIAQESAVKKYLVTYENWPRKNWLQKKLYLSQKPIHVKIHGQDQMVGLNEVLTHLHFIFIF